MRLYNILRITRRYGYLNKRISQFSDTIVFSRYNYPCNVCCHNRNVKNVNYLVCSSMPPQLLWHNGTRNMNICWPNISYKARSEWIWKHATAIYYYSDDNALSSYMNLISLFLNCQNKKYNSNEISHEKYYKHVHSIIFPRIKDLNAFPFFLSFHLHCISYTLYSSDSDDILLSYYSIKKTIPPVNK